MVLTAAEKQKRYRERMKQDPEKYQCYLQAERKRWKTRRSEGKIKGIKEMSTRAQRQQRRQWKTQQKECRQRKKNARCLETPPNSPLDHEEEPKPTTSRQKLQGKKAARALKAKQKYRNQRTEARAEMYKKRWQRELAKHRDPPTPRTKTRNLLQCAPSTAIRKTLEFHHTIIDQWKCKFRSLKEAKMKKLYARMFTGGLLRKYRMQKVAEEKLCFSSKIRRSGQKNEDLLVKMSYKSVSYRFHLKVREFYLRDDVSRVTTSKKETVTRNKVKKQKRLLNDSRKNLYEKFQAENPEVKISYSIFCRLRPFWVVTPTEKNRDTCLCKLHDNLQFLANKLKLLKVIDTNYLDTLVTFVSCNTDNKNCMYGDCEKCRDSSCPHNIEDANVQTTWTQWKTVKEDRHIKRKGKSEAHQVSLTVKHVENGTIYDLFVQFQEQLSRFKKHYFNIRHQYQFYQKLRTDMSKNEALIHIDFAENYVGKMSKAIQSCHFGASQIQMTLHTGVYYVGHASKPYTFCTISDSLEHGPAAIWMYLSPVLDDIQQNHPDVNILHFYSNGPTTQYRQKGNFYLFTTELFNRGIKMGTWNFHESGHGKGVPDGVGAALKRTADNMVYQGTDITNAAALYQALKDAKTTVQIYFVASDVVQKTVEKFAELKLPTVPGTMRLHQVLSKASGEISYREVSCFCGPRKICKCYEKKDFKFAPQPFTCFDYSVPTSYNHNIDYQLADVTPIAQVLSNHIPNSAVVSETVQNSPQPAVSETVQGSPQPVVLETVQGSSQPAVSETVQHSPQPAVSETVQGSSQPAVSETVQNSPQPAVSETIQGSPQPAVSETVQNSPQPAVSETVKGSPQPVVLETVQGSSQPAVSETIQGSPQPAVSETIQGSPKPAVSEIIQTLSGCKHKPYFGLLTLGSDSETSLDNLLNKFVIVNYDNTPYPGEVLDIDQADGDVQVKCMHNIGRNRFFWPVRHDVCWYKYDDILAIIPEPQKVTARHHQVDPKIWEETVTQLE